MRIYGWGAHEGPPGWALGREVAYPLGLFGLFKYVC